MDCKSVMVMPKEHQAAQKEFKWYRNLSHNYIPPVDAHYSYKNLFEKKRAFENEL